jgi:hypothetical protein
MPSRRRKKESENVWLVIAIAAKFCLEKSECPEFFTLILT